MADSDIRLHVTKERFDELTWEDWGTLEAFLRGDTTQATMERMRKLAARFVVDAKKKYVDEQVALDLLAGLKGKAIGAAVGELANKILEYAVPKENGSAST